MSAGHEEPMTEPPPPYTDGPPDVPEQDDVDLP